MVKPISAHDMVPALLKELPTYLSLAASSPPFDRTDMPDYSAKLLRWWRDNCPSLPAWSKAARMVFALSCTSAASERVFSLVDAMFGRDQLRSLADQLQAGVMLRYNKRIVG